MRARTTALLLSLCVAGGAGAQTPTTNTENYISSLTPRGDSIVV